MGLMIMLNQGYYRYSVFKYVIYMNTNISRHINYVNDIIEINFVYNKI